MKLTTFIFLLFVIVFFNASKVTCQQWEENIVASIQKNRNSKNDNFYRGVTNSYSYVGLITPASIYTAGLLKKNSQLKNHSYVMGFSIFTSTAIVLGLKYATKRDRPFVNNIDINNLSNGSSTLTPSFPSGHTSIAFSTATSLSIAFPRWYVIAPAYVWAGSIGYSRMYLGVHYTTDVLVGALIGSGCAFLASYISKKMNTSKKSLENEFPDTK